MQSRLHCLYRLCPLSNTLLGRLYCASILPILDYCDIVWSPSSVQFFKRLEHVHSKFCSLLSATQGFFHCTLVECRRFHTAIMVYKILHHLSPIYLQDTFKYTTTVTSHVGRNSYCLLCREFGPLMARTLSFIYCRYASLEFITRIPLHCSHSWTI